MSSGEIESKESLIREICAKYDIPDALKAPPEIETLILRLYEDANKSGKLKSQVDELYALKNNLLHVIDEQLSFDHPSLLNKFKKFKEAEKVLATISPPAHDEKLANPSIDDDDGHAISNKQRKEFQVKKDIAMSRKEVDSENSEDQLLSEIRRLKSKNAQLKARIEAGDVHFGNPFEKEKKKVDAPIYDIVSKLTARRQTQDQTVHELESHLADIKKRSLEAEAELIRVNQELNDARITLDYDQQYIKFLKAHIESLVSESNKEQEEEGVSSLQIKYQQILTAYDGLLHTLSEYKGSHKLMAAHIEDQDKTIESHVLDHGSLKTSLKGTQLALRDLNLEYEALRHEYAQLSANYTSIQAEHDEKEKECQYLNAVIDEKITLGQNLASQLKSKELEWASLQSAYKKLLVEHERLSKEISYYKSEVEKLSKNYFTENMTVNMHSKELEEAKNLMKKYKASILSLEHELNELKITLLNKDSLNQQLHLENSRLAQQLHPSRTYEQIATGAAPYHQNQLQDKLSALETQLRETLGQKGALSIKVAQEEKNTALLKSHFKLIKNENKALKAVIKNMEKIMQENSPESRQSGEDKIDLYDGTGAGTHSAGNPLFTPTPPVPAMESHKRRPTRQTNNENTGPGGLHIETSPITTNSDTNFNHSTTDEDREADEILSQHTLEEWYAHSQEFLQQLAQLKSDRQKVKSQGENGGGLDRLTNFIQQENKLLTNIFKQVKADLERASAKSPTKGVIHDGVDKDQGESEHREPVSGATQFYSPISPPATSFKEQTTY